MQILSDRLVYSATDLNNFLACEHLTALERDAALHRLLRPAGDSGQAALLSQLGADHEQNELQRLREAGHRVTSIDRQAGLARAAAETEAEMARGDEVIYQAAFLRDEWAGYADFLQRVSAPVEGGRWEWQYEVADTKLARHTEPASLLQLAYYSAHIAHVQGAAPTHMRVVLGNGTIATFRVADAAAYERRVRERFLAVVRDETRTTYPIPVPHCSLCDWREACEQQWRQDDHLSLVAGATRLQVERLTDAGITTLRALAEAAPDHKPPKMAPATYETLRRQARLQHEQRLAQAAGEPDPLRYELLASGIEPQRGFFRLPAPSPGDVFFDMEGDPYYELEAGLEYLFGATTADGAFRAFWGCDRAPAPQHDRLAEKRAFEQFVDFVLARHAQWPDMHVYHYAPYEKTALQTLALRHATREDEVDRILRAELLVDLYAIVRQAVAVGQPSYSIKKLEEFYGKRGTESGIAAGDDSILRFEEWLARRGDPATRDDAILADLERYNRYDCDSTLGLRDWLLTLRDEAQRTFGVAIPPYAGRVEPAPEPVVKHVELKAALDARLPASFDPAAGAADPAWPFFLARHLLEYHWREDKPVYWRFHDRCETYLADPTELLDDPECLVALELIGEPVPVKRSLEFRFRFPQQLTKIDKGSCYDLASKEYAGSVQRVEEDDDGGVLVLRKGVDKNARPVVPRAITVKSIVPADTVLDALARFAQALLDGTGRYRAAEDVLLGRPPRLHGLAPGGVLQPAHVDEAALRALVDALDASYLFVQGPPGAGKTYLGARLIVGLIAAGKRVGVTANSHRAIHNLLDEVEAVARARGVDFRGRKKCTAGDDDTFYHGAHFDNDPKSIADPAAQLVAGTAWAFGAEPMDQQLDYLFVDEAGQVALPHAVAVLTAARNAVLLGDPLQLPQVAHTQHPGDLGASVLEHLLGGDLRPVAPDRGVLLTDSYRMHPDVCGFISELLYEERLHAAPDRERQAVDSPGLAGTGLRYLAVEHRDNTQASGEEAQRIAREIATLLAGRVCDVHGVWRPLTPADVMVVTPYNAQVRRLRTALDAAGLHDVEAGTVDKFQGREAYVVFYSVAASRPDLAARGPGFVFDRQRFNVAISRARALAILVAAPAMLDFTPHSIEEVKVANGVCRFLERCPEADRP